MDSKTFFNRTKYIEDNKDGQFLNCNNVYESASFLEAEYEQVGVGGLFESDKKYFYTISCEMESDIVEYDNDIDWNAIFEGRA